MLLYDDRKPVVATQTVTRASGFTLSSTHDLQGAALQRAGSRCGAVGGACGGAAQRQSKRRHNVEGEVRHMPLLLLSAARQPVSAWNVLGGRARAHWCATPPRAACSAETLACKRRAARWCASQKRTLNKAWPSRSCEAPAAPGELSQPVHSVADWPPVVVIDTRTGRF